MLQGTIKVGDRVESTLANNDVVQGVIRSIFVQMTNGGPAALFKVSVDRKNGVDHDGGEIDTPAHLWDVPGARAACVDCNEVHASPFGAKVLDTFAQYQKADAQGRAVLLVQIADDFVSQLSTTEMAVPEALHMIAGEIEEAACVLYNKQTRLGRTLVAYLVDQTRVKTLKDVFPGGLARIVDAFGQQGHLEPATKKEPLN
jgi:hypothetical protein